jgi:hypothetical protein
MLNFSDITSMFCIVTDLHNVFHPQGAGMFEVYFHTKFHTATSIVSLVMEILHMANMLFLESSHD